MVMNNDFHNRDDFMEKCQDSINYIRFLWCIGNEEMDKYAHEGVVCEDLEEFNSYLKEKESEENEEDK